MELLFREKRPDEVEQEVTQRDQFNSDEVTLTATLVRETNQNSLDAKAAGSSSPVRVKMYFVTPADEHSKYFPTLFTGLRVHLEASDVDVAGINFTQPKLLVIEDFGTTGLTGNWNIRDNGAFSDFWRRTGRSHKGGKSGGRWGLGKLVFSSSSKIRTFFGLTIRPGDPHPLLMGQVVLANHVVGGKEFAPHGFFAERGPSGFQLPVVDPQEINRFVKCCGITRTSEPGLSVVIPFVLDEITGPDLIAEVVRNYFFPILTGQLEMEVDGERISASNFDSIAAKYAKARTASAGLIDFIRALHLRKEAAPDSTLGITWAKGIETALEPKTLEDLRESFNKDGKLTHVRLPVTLRPKDGASVETFFDLFLKRAPEGEQGDALFVRSAITVPDEARFFRGRQVFGALIASDIAITSFLGDAENPAHTRWNGSAEKLQKNWKAAKTRLSEIRNSLNGLYQALSQAVEFQDENALIDVFYILDESDEKRRAAGKRKRTDTPPIPPLKPSPKLYTISSRKGGFSIRSGPALTVDKLPLKLKIRAAYDILQGNPFKHYNVLDFDFGSADFQIAATGATHSVAGTNELSIDATAPEFSVDVLGFDEHRDIIVKASR